MKYFLDSAKLDEIKYAYENYGIDGVTTNPKHIKLSGKPFMTCVKEIAQWLKDAGLEGKDFPVSFEINPHLDKADDIVAAAKEVASYSPNYCIKIPCCKEGLIAARRLEKEGVRTNVTLVFSPSQAIPAAKLGAKGVKNIAVYDASKTDVSELIAEISAYLKEIAKIYKNYGYKTEIIAAAVRNGRQISELAEAGIDIVTCGLAVYEASFEHPFTTHGLGIFREAWDSTATE